MGIQSHVLSTVYNVWRERWIQTEFGIQVKLKSPDRERSSTRIAKGCEGECGLLEGTQPRLVLLPRTFPLDTPVHLDLQALPHFIPNFHLAAIPSLLYRALDALFATPSLVEAHFGKVSGRERPGTVSGCMAQ